MKTSWLLPVIILCMIAVFVYYTVDQESLQQHTPAVLRVGVLPDVSEDALRQRYTPLLNYLSTQTALKFKLVLPADYNELIELFDDHKIDLAYFGGLTFVRAQINSDAKPLVMRELDTHFTSWFIVSGDELAPDLTDMEGKSFAFGSKLSTSGHLMPRHFLQTQKQIIAEQFFGEVHYSGAHDRTVYLVRDGKVELGVANTQIIKAMQQDGRLLQGDVRVIWETPPYADYVWATQAYINDHTRTLLRDAFLALDVADPAHKMVLDRLGASAFLPAVTSQFQRLENIADKQGLLERLSQ